MFDKTFRMHIFLMLHFPFYGCVIHKVAFMLDALNQTVIFTVSASRETSRLKCWESIKVQVGVRVRKAINLNIPQTYRVQFSLSLPPAGYPPSMAYNLSMQFWDEHIPSVQVAQSSLLSERWHEQIMIFLDRINQISSLWESGYQQPPFTIPLRSINR